MPWVSSGCSSVRHVVWPKLPERFPRRLKRQLDYHEKTLHDREVYSLPRPTLPSISTMPFLSLLLVPPIMHCISQRPAALVLSKFSLFFRVPEKVAASSPLCCRIANCVLRAKCVLGKASHTQECTHAFLHRSSTKCCYFLLFKDTRRWREVISRAPKYMARGLFRWCS